MDLAPRAWLADRVESRDVALFGTPGSEQSAADGFHWETDGTAFAWASQECEARFEWQKVVPRLAVIELGASPGNEDQEVTVALNGHRLARFGVAPTMGRHKVNVPAESQRVGENRMSFSFSQAGPVTPGAVRRIAARVASIVVGPAADQGVDDLTIRDAPRMLAAVPPEAPRDIVQVGPSTLSFTLSLPRDAELRVTPTLHPGARAAGSQVDVAVLAQTDTGGPLPSALWTARLDARAAPLKEIRVPLPSSGPDEPIRVSLRVGGQSDARFAWVAWLHPRIVSHESPIIEGSGVSAGGAQDRTWPLRSRLPSDVGVILIVIDAARAQNLTPYHYARPTTPAIDRIASEGVVFERAYTPAVHTLGAMSSVWTSLYPDAHHRGLPFSAPLPAGLPTLAEALSRAGVHTYGVIANAMAGKASGLERGFETFREIYDNPTFGSRAEVFRQGLADLLDRWRSGRFFAYLHFREPHFPYDPPKAYATLFGPDAPLTKAERSLPAWYTAVNEGRIHPTPEQVAHMVRLYDGNLVYVDAEIGRLRRELEARGIWDKSVVIVMADHGEQLYEDGYIGHSAQVREESARVPLIVRFPAQLGLTHRRVTALVDLLDVAPTIAQALNVPWPPEDARNGGSLSLLPVIDGAPGNGAVLVRTVWERPKYALVSGHWKLEYDTRTGHQRLIDLDADPHERTDLAGSHPIRASALRQAMFAWVARLARGPRLTAGPSTRTVEECENLCALGYVDCADCK